MGVVSNKNNINDLMLGMEALPQIMTSVSNCVEAVAYVQTSVRNINIQIGTIENDIANMDIKTQITITPYNSRVGNVQKIYAFIRNGILFANFKWKQLVAATGADSVQAVLDGFEYNGSSNAFVDGYNETSKTMKQYYIGKNTDNKMVIRSVDTVSVDDIITFDLVIPIY